MLASNTSTSIPFGAGPHFCAGAAASRVLISELALPQLFKAFPNLELTDEVNLGGAFLGLLVVEVRANCSGRSNTPIEQPPNQN